MRIPSPGYDGKTIQLDPPASSLMGDVYIWREEETPDGFNWVKIDVTDETPLAFVRQAKSPGNEVCGRYLKFVGEVYLNSEERKLYKTPQQWHKSDTDSTSLLQHVTNWSSGYFIIPESYN